MKVLIKAMRPHRQKVLTEDGEEMRLQQWANKAASSALRGAGGDANGEQFTQARDALMREAVANPNEHGLKFMGERMPFDGQELEESLSEPDVEGEMPQTPDLFDEQGKLRDGMPPEEEFNWEKGEAEYMRNLKPPEEEFNPDAEAEHMRRIMTSRQVPMRDAWSVLKNDFFNPPEVPCAKCGKPTEPMMYYGSNQMGPQHNTLCEECEDNTMMEDQ